MEVGHSTFTGLILQATYRIESGVAVPRYCGRLVTGETFLVRLPGVPRPHFWVSRQDAQHALLAGRARLTEARRVSMESRALTRVEVALPRDVPPLRDRLHQAGVATYEADVRFALRPLIDRQIRSAVRIIGPPLDGAAARRLWGVDLAFTDAELQAVELEEPLHLRLAVLSVDIETNWSTGEILSIGLYGAGASEVLLRQPSAGSPADSVPPAGGVLVGSERELLRCFATRLGEIDPDVITGWSVIDFDLAVISRRAEKLNVELELGRQPGRLEIVGGRSRRLASRAQIAGRVVLDGPTLLRSSFIRTERSSLDFVARQVLGEGKTLAGGQRAETIIEWFNEQRERFVEYNLTDCRLVIEILEELRLVELSIARSRMTGLPLDRVASSIAAFEFLYLGELARRGMAAPSARPDRTSGTVGGGAVLTPRPGLYENVVVFDFKSLYPSIMRTFQVDPLAFAQARLGGSAKAIQAPNGAAFARGKGILPGLLERLFPLREAAKRRDDEVTSTAIKILMNSFFGVLGAPSCRFFDLEVSNAITSFGRELLHWCRQRAEEEGYEVLYGDTDSLFVATAVQDHGDAGAARARLCARQLLQRLNRALTQHVEEEWEVENHLELEFEKLYTRLFLPPLRHSQEGAAKKYVGQVHVREGVSRVEFTGLEAVRRDWTDFARNAQRVLYSKLFDGEPVDEFIAAEAAAVRRGERDQALIYRKRLRKGLEEYTANAPHVAAARLMDGSTLGTRDLIEYVITTSGPEPADERRAPIDYEHYVAKQLRPVAEPVLDLLELQFDRVIGDDRQILLF